MPKDVIVPRKSKIFRYLKSYVFLGHKKIGFYANFGHGDLGDDASFLVSRKLIGEDIIPISKRCYAFNPRILKVLLIGCRATLHWKSPYIPRRLLMRDKWNFPVILFSAGLNHDYHKEFTKEAEEKIKRLCRVCDYLTVRDKLSQRFINNLGFNNVNILPDLELALEEKPKEFNFNKKRFTVGIVLTPHSAFSPSVFKKIVVVFSQFTDYLTHNGLDVIYLPFEGESSENTKERQLIREIIQNLRQRDRVRVLETNVDPGELLFTIKNYCDAMICTRLHSAVFSTNAEIPFLCISYNMMHNGFLEMLDAQDLDISIFNGFSFEVLRDKFEYILKNYGDIKARLIKKRGYLKSLIYKEIFYIKKTFNIK